MTLSDLAARLRQFAECRLSLAELRASFIPVLESDPLDIAMSDPTPWDHSPDDSRLYWRLLHLFDGAGGEDEDALRQMAAHVVDSLDDAGGATTLELLPLLLDQDRLRTILRKYDSGIISRTGWLSVIAESGYPGHVKLWLQHAGPDVLRLLGRLLGDGEYARVAAMFAHAP